MNVSRLALLLAVAIAALGLGACGDDDDSDATASSSTLVSVEDVSGTDVLADAEGRTLYTTTAENDGRILCTGACTSFWDPIPASADEASTAADELGLELGVVERPDGDSQLALTGVPLYAFTEEGPGELTGDGFVDDFQGTRFEWQAATAASEPAAEDSSDGGGGPYGGY